MQRLPGIFFIGALGFLLWVCKDARKALTYLILVIMPLAGWLYRNTFFEDTPSFQANILVSPFLQNLVTYVEIVGNWFVPSQLLFVYKAICVGLILVKIGWVAYSYRPKRTSFFVHATVMASFYLFGMIFTNTNGGIWEVDRYAMPAFVWVIASFFASWDLCLLRILKAHKLLIVGLLGIWLVYPICRVVKNVLFWHIVNCQKTEYREALTDL